MSEREPCGCGERQMVAASEGVTAYRTEEGGLLIANTSGRSLSGVVVSLTASGRGLIRPEDVERLAYAPALDSAVARLRGY